MTEEATPARRSQRPGAALLLSDDRLAQRATKGDERAFAAIYSRYQVDLYRFCLAILGSREDAQDALQNTMVKVLRALPGETRQIKLKPWLYRIAHNEAIELLRRRRDTVEIEPEVLATSGGPADTAASRERLRALLSDLRELPERQRAALVMRELADLSFAQIGAAFETSAAVGRQTVYEARVSLRQMQAGREMSCESVMQALSDADGRVTRRREIRAHLRSCPDCRSFRDAIAERRRDFAAIAPLPLAASIVLLHGVIGANGAGAGAAVGAGAAGAGAAGTGGAAGAVATGVAATAATSTVVKSVATVAVVAAVGAGAADRGGLIETPLPESIGGAKSAGPTPGGAPGSDNAAERRTDAEERSSRSGFRRKASGRAALRGGVRSDVARLRKRAAQGGRPIQSEAGRREGRLPSGKGFGGPPREPGSEEQGPGRPNAGGDRSHGGMGSRGGSRGEAKAHGKSRGGRKSKKRPSRKSQQGVTPSGRRDRPEREPVTTPSVPAEETDQDGLQEAETSFPDDGSMEEQDASGIQLPTG